MGKGKGNVDKWAVWIKRGQVLYEMRGISSYDAIKSVNNLNSKLPIKVRLTVNYFRK
jgi:ribosomal protein L16/L10AE